MLMRKTSARLWKMEEFSFLYKSYYHFFVGTSLFRQRQLYNSERFLYNSSINNSLTFFLKPSFFIIPHREKKTSREVIFLKKKILIQAYFLSMRHGSMLLLLLLLKSVSCCLVEEEGDKSSSKHQSAKYNYVEILDQHFCHFSNYFTLFW